MRFKTPLALGLLQAAALAAKKDTAPGIGSQIIDGFTAIPAGGTGLIIAVVIIFVAAFAVGFFVGTR